MGYVTGLTLTRETDTRLEYEYRWQGPTGSNYRTRLSLQIDNGLPQHVGFDLRPQAGALVSGYVTNVEGGHYYRLVAWPETYHHSAWYPDLAEFSNWCSTSPKSLPSVEAQRASATQVSFVWPVEAGRYKSDYSDPYVEVRELGNDNVLAQALYSAGRVGPVTTTAAEHTYDLRVVSHLGGGESESYTIGVAALAAPLAPADLYTSPQHIKAGVSQRVTISWRHRSSDPYGQRHAQFSYSTNSGTSWAIWNVHDPGTKETSIAGLNRAAGSTFHWRVRTAGLSGTYGPWSSMAQIYVDPVPAFSLNIRPTTVTSDQATVIGTVDMSTKPAQWPANRGAFVDVQVTGTAGYTSVYSTETESDGSYTLTFDGLQNNTSYTITETPRFWVSGDPFVWTASVSYAAPPTPSVEASWDEDTGAVYGRIISSAGSGDTAVKYASVQVWQAGSWVDALTNLYTSSYFSLPALDHSQDNYIRIVNYTALGIPAYSAPLFLSASEAPVGVYLNYGAQLGTAVRLDRDITIKDTTSRVNTSYVYTLANDRPVLLDTGDRAHTWDISGYIGRSSHEWMVETRAATLLAAAHSDGVAVIRFTDRAPIRGYIDSVAVNRDVASRYSYTIGMTEVADEYESLG